jgi:hypothetical protein
MLSIEPYFWCTLMFFLSVKKTHSGIVVCGKLWKLYTCKHHPFQVSGPIVSVESSHAKVK